MEEEARNKHIKETIEDLQSRNERRIIGALNRIPHEGSPEMIAPLFGLMLHDHSEEVRMLLDKIVFNLKDPNCVEPIIDLLQNPAYTTVQSYVLSAIWQSGLDVSDHVEILVNLAATGDFITAVEVITIIESSEFDNDDGLSAAIKKMDKVVESKGDNQALMVSLRELLLEKLLT